MDHIPAREWTDTTTPRTTATLRVAETKPGIAAILISVGEWSDDVAGAATVALTPEQYAELITDGIRRLALMRGRRAAVEAVAAAVPETRLRGRNEWELTEKAHQALSAAESPDTPVTGVAAADGERVPLRDRGAKSTTMWTRRNSSSGDFGLRPAEGADGSVGGGSTPGTGDEPPHGPAGRPEPVDLP